VNELTLLDGAARGMAAQRTLLDLAARNLAAAQAASPGHPYQRLVAHELAARGGEDDPFVPADLAAIERFDGAPDDADAVVVGREAANGDTLTELIAALDAQRAFEANASVFDIGKRIAERTLDVER
jgi:flagellar basal body rod protein FlgC